MRARTSQPVHAAIMRLTELPPSFHHHCTDIAHTLETKAPNKQQRQCGANHYWHTAHARFFTTTAAILMLFGTAFALSIGRSTAAANQLQFPIDLARRFMAHGDIRGCQSARQKPRGHVIMGQQLNLVQGTCLADLEDCCDTGVCVGSRRS